MNALDYVVLVITILGIAYYGIWRTRDRRTFNTYLKGEVGSSRVDLQACKLEYSIVSPK